MHRPYSELAAGDMIAIEAKYYHNCLRSLYNRARKAAPKDNDEDDSCLHGIAFSELVAFLEGNNSDEDIAPVFKLVDLTEMYKVRLEQLGATVEKRIHATRLKNRLLTVLPDLRAYSQGRDTLLSFEKNIRPALMMACSHDSDAMHLMRAAKVCAKKYLTQVSCFMGRSRQTARKKLCHHPFWLWST